MAQNICIALDILQWAVTYIFTFELHIHNWDRQYYHKIMMIKLKFNWIKWFAQNHWVGKMQHLNL